MLMLRPFFPKGFVVRALLPEEGEVEEKEDVSHDGTAGKEAAIEEGMEADDVDRDREEQESGEGGATCPKTVEGDEVHDGIDDHDILALHEEVDELEGFRCLVHVSGRRRKDAESAEDGHDEQKREKDFSNNGEDGVVFHRIWP